ncbi:MAG: response regulator transcription factor [Clostridioides sp.]|jgi:DNA-binding response OmpR family regulator|nr:response regulator transcription factor [Clostridioides sp.]
MVIDDDPYIRELLMTLLTKTGEYEVVESKNGRAALAKISTERVDLCILDIMMPDMDGFEFLELFRKYHDEIPVLMLTAKYDIADKVRGFNLGADDYMVKPFESAELIVRVKALLKRYNILSSKSIRVGRIEIDKESYIVNFGEDRIELPLKEFELLYTLANSVGRTLTRDTLIEEVWGYDFDGNERTLDVHINRLRDKFKAEECGLKISTVRGLGYRLEEVR